MRAGLSAALALLLVVGAACSGSGDGATSPTTQAGVTGPPESLDQPGFRSAAADVCADADRGGDIGEPVGASSTVDEIDTQYDRIETRLELLRELPVPDGEDAAVDEIVQAYDRVLTALDELSTAVDGDDTQSAILVATALEGLRADATDLATAYGIAECAL